MYDDEHRLARTLKKMSNLLCHRCVPNIQVYSFNNPVTDLVDFKPNFYDLLLIDVIMPLMDNFQLVQNLLRRNLNVRVCFMTSGEINKDVAREVHPLKSAAVLSRSPLLQNSS